MSGEQDGTLNDTGELHGVFDMPEHTYLADPVPGGSLSASGAKLILKAPAKFRHRETTGTKEYKDTFDFGTAAHAHVLGTGAPVEVCDFPNWTTKAAREAKTEAREKGRTPILVKDWATVEAMARALREHPIAAALLAPGSGMAEQSLFWAADGIQKRARVDFLPNVVEGKRYLIADYKTTAEDGAETRQFERAIGSYGYAMQASFYSEGVATLLGVDPKFLFICQEKVAPYLVNVIEPSAEWMQIGADLCKRAVEVYRECRETGVWPGYPVGVDRALVPQYVAYQHADLLASWGWDVAS